MRPFSSKRILRRQVDEQTGAEFPDEEIIDGGGDDTPSGGGEGEQEP